MSADALEEPVAPTWRSTLWTFVTWRGLLLAMAFVALPLIPRLGSCRPQWEVFGKGHDFWNGFFRWDAGWYRFIAEVGYTFHPDKTSSVAFYPLYPHLSRWLGRALGSPFIAGLFISSAGTLVGIHYMRRLGALLFPRETAERSVVLLLLFPTSFFLSAFYTEGLFFGLAAASFYFFQREQYVKSGAVGGLAMLTRSSGLALFAALALDLALRLVRRRTRFHPSALGLALIPAGLGVFMWILKVQVGDPLAFKKVMIFWHRESCYPWVPLVAAYGKLSKGFPSDFDSAQVVIDAMFALSFLVAGAAMTWRSFVTARGTARPDSPEAAGGARPEFPLAFGVFVLAGVLLPLSTTNIASMGRYVLALFPAFYWFAHATARRPVAAQVLTVSSTFFLALYMMRFMRCAWAG